MSQSDVLVLYYSRYGATAQLAQEIAKGVGRAGLDAKIRTVPPVVADNAPSGITVPEAGAPYVTLDDLSDCCALAVGSPAYFGGMAAPMKHFWDTTSALWVQGSLVNKPAAVFTSASTMHGAQEATLLGMMMPLLHHGCLISGIPYTEAKLNTTQTGGTPYGASHYAGADSNAPLSMEEKALAKALGQRLGQLACQLCPRHD